MIDAERKLLERLAGEGKAMRLALGEVAAAKSLEKEGLVFMVGRTAAVITPKDAIFSPASRHRRSPTRSRRSVF